MRIAVSTADGVTICGHLGKCRSFIIYETDGDKVTGKTVTGTAGACPSHGGDGQHNVSPFAGCHAVITQGMGGGMLNGLMQAGIQPVITSQTDPDAAVLAFMRGELAGTSKATCGDCGEH
ncbi:MAG: hypothetical protein HZA22_00770 [Nitrospirae bacterium]|nr:hypothetical protein [Nitrospirota bacterium]MBI5695647.1 hypothetical protein [Nitrospirota bacterium]